MVAKLVRFFDDQFLYVDLSCVKIKLDIAAVRSFEELRCWQKARELVNMVYAVTQQGPIVHDFEMKNQIRRAALSVMNNIAEGFGRESNKEFLRFLDISHASCVEVKSMTYILEDLRYLPTADTNNLRLKADEIKGLTRGLMKYLRANIEH